METRKYSQYEASDKLKTQVVAEIARAKAMSKMRDCDIANALGKSKQGYSSLANNLSRIGSIEAIANVLGYDVEIKLVEREK